ncbi:MAG: CDP-alcohol phosphatidyltransferase family protein [Gemmatimonadota bacterium]|nr:CDP-alcohol phosphatidyltransferase family protein [Gemmatimonadota bacterium]
MTLPHRNLTDSPEGDTASAAPPHRAPVRWRAAGDLLVAFAALLGIGTVTRSALGLPAAYSVVLVGGYGVLATLLIAFLPVHLPRPGIGWANRVTLFRATLTLPVAALVLVPGMVEGPAAWWVIGLGAAASVLDGVDGWLARVTDTHTPFGARFDMELDAFLILALSALVWTSTPIGPWVLGIGLIRYAFVLAGRLLPHLEAPLPPSVRRKAVCVIQTVALLVALGPPVPTVLAVTSAALALAALVYSFTVDLRWLHRHRPSRRPTRDPTTGRHGSG